MTKTEAIAIFGTRQIDLADALGVTKSAISQWPEELDTATADRVIGAATRLNKPITDNLSRSATAA
jgi:transcriptional regulator with XRE-family HTH domain